MKVFFHLPVFKKDLVKSGSTAISTNLFGGLLAMIGVGYSHFKNPVKAAKEAASLALSQLQGKVCHSCLVFSTVGYSQDDLLHAIHDEIGDVPMVGCSCEGVISKGIADESSHCVAVMAMADPRIHLDTAGYPDLTDSSKTGRALGKLLAEKLQDDSRCIILLPCGANAIGDDLLGSLETELGRNLPIIGGGAGDNLTGGKTYQYHDWRIYEGGVSAAVLSGDFDLLTAVSHGCTPVGLEMEITRAEGNRIYEIDNRLSLDLLKEFVGEEIIGELETARAHFCIGQITENELEPYYDQYIIRAILPHLSEDKSVLLPVKLQKGTKIWLCRRDHDKIISAAMQSLITIKENLQEKSPFLVMDFNCAARGKLILSDNEKTSLLQFFQSRFSADFPWIGFFAFGEFCPIRQQNVYHNFTDVFALFVWK